MYRRFMFDTRYKLMKRLGVCITLGAGVLGSFCPLPVKHTICFGTFHTFVLNPCLFMCTSASFRGFQMNLCASVGVPKAPPPLMNCCLHVCMHKPFTCVCINPSHVYA